MQTNATPEAILQGDVQYSIPEYLADLRQAILAAFPPDTEANPMVRKQIEDLFRFLVRVLDLAALDKSPYEIAQAYNPGRTLEGLDVEQIEAALEEHDAKLQILKAIYKRIFMECLVEARDQEKAYEMFLGVRAQAVGGV